MGRSKEQTAEGGTDYPQFVVETPIKKRVKKVASKPRRRRNQAKRACKSCRKSHSACGAERPCRRCVSKGLGHLCVDAPKKRKEATGPLWEGEMVLKFDTPSPSTSFSHSSSFYPGRFSRFSTVLDGKQPGQELPSFSQTRDSLVPPPSFDNSPCSSPTSPFPSSSLSFDSSSTPSFCSSSPDVSPYCSVPSSPLSLESPYCSLPSSPAYTSPCSSPSLFDSSDLFPCLKLEESDLWEDYHSHESLYASLIRLEEEVWAHQACLLDNFYSNCIS